jgi:hypothetical protein
MITGPSLRQLAPSGTTTLWYVPGANTSVHVVVFEPASAEAGRQTSKAAANVAGTSGRMHRIMTGTSLP